MSGSGFVFADGVVTQQYGLGPTRPPNWAADEVIYRLLSYVDAGDGPQFHYIARQNYTPAEVPDIDVFVHNLATGTIKPLVKSGTRLVQTSAARLAKAPNPWDIEVYHRCYIVLELDRTKSWTFQSGADAVTTALDHADIYFYLKHISGAGAVLPGQPVDTDLCRILYFGVEKPSGYHNDKFNISVQYQQSAGSAPQGATFDPDIKNNGGPPFLPPA